MKSLHTLLTDMSPDRNLYIEMHCFKLTDTLTTHNHPAPKLSPYRMAGNLIYRVGVKYWGESDLDGGISFAVFNRDEIEPEEALKVMGWDNAVYYDPQPGQFFSNLPNCKVQGSRILLTRQWGYDC